MSLCNVLARFFLAATKDAIPDSSYYRRVNISTTVSDPSSRSARYRFLFSYRQTLGVFRTKDSAGGAREVTRIIAAEEEDDDGVAVNSWVVEVEPPKLIV